MRLLRSDELGVAEVRSLRALMDLAFDGEFADEDWDHALGGLHAIATIDGVIVAHAAVVPRVLHIDDVAVPTGYVEAVATHPSVQRCGFGSGVMRELVPEIQRIGFGALSTSSISFYERLGWLRWAGPTYVIHDQEWLRTPDEDGGVMVLLAPGGPAPVGVERIGCPNRSGDAW